MMKHTRKIKALALILALVMTALAVPFQVFALDQTMATTPVTDATDTAISANSGEVGLRDYTIPTDSKHAYDPFARLESEAATEEYRNSVKYEAGSIIYKVNATKGWLGGYRDAYDGDALESLGIDLTTAEEISIKRVDDGFFRDTYEIIYEAKLSGDVWEAVDALATLDGVVDAQPNYLYEETAMDVPTSVAKNPDKDKQWYHGPDHLECDKHWQHMHDDDITPGEGAIVAVIDTGVDYTHIDLAANMWVNTAELNGVDGVDDDGNGYIDDIHGVSTVGAKPFHSGNPMDDHGHGTHVAGIIAMTANNSEGGVGVAYGAKIMAIKAGQATGVFNDADIAEAINYAVAMGADVINMSFGGVGRSFLVEEALSDAFATTVLVAAAGNNGWPTSDAPPPYELFVTKGTFYPAGYTYVIGVMASDQYGNFASFSNWDYITNGGDGEYEIVAPGVEIYSTLPGNQYAAWSGTSMASPMVAAAAALVRSKYADREKYSSRFIMGQLAGATEDVVWRYPALNLDDALNKLPKPNLYVKNLYLFDDPSIDPANDGDGLVDAGETIEVGLVLRNQWGMAGDITVTMDANNPSSGIAHPQIEWLKDTITMSEIGTFNELDNGFIYDGDLLVGAENPIRFKVKDDTINDAHIGLNIIVTAKNAMDDEDTTLYTFENNPYGYETTFYVQRGKTLSGRLEEDTTLTKEHYWILDSSLYVPEGVTLTIEAGTQVQFWGDENWSPIAMASIVYLLVDGELLVKGTEEEPVEMFPSAAFGWYAVEITQGTRENSFVGADRYVDAPGYIDLRYAEIINPEITADYGEHLTLIQDSDTLSRRYIVGGVVAERSLDSGIGSKVLFGQLKKSRVAGLRNRYSIGSPTSGFVDGVFDEVVFDKCDLYNSGYWSSEVAEKERFINCVFLNSNENFSGLYAPGYRYQTAKNTFSEILTYNGKKYVCVTFGMYFWQNNPLSEYKGDAVVDTHLKATGGEWACFESEEEKNAVCAIIPTIGSVYIGLRRDPQTGEFSWKNGSTSYFPNDLSGDSDHPYGYMTSSSYINATNAFISGNPCLFEYPDTVSDEEIVRTLTASEFWSNCPEKYYPFTNNAILNHLDTANRSYWMKIEASTNPKDSFGAQKNYWGTVDPRLVNAQLLDFDTFVSYGDILTDPLLTLDSPALEAIYPFVTEIYLTDSEGRRIETAGYLQDVTVHVKFNRDMDTEVQPMVSYGPAAPYTDYLLEGDFVSAREWCADFTIKGVIDAGKEFFRVKGAVAADDAWLVTGTDEARFAFAVTRTNAEALTLQASGGENQIALSWTQDDYDTLAGFNVYRATSADGEFERINSYLVPGTIREYVDTNVEAGVEYFYYFTVMGTDLVESLPSNVASATANDNIKPLVTHARVTQANAGEAFAVNVIASDNIGIAYVKVFYRVKGSESYKTLTLNLTDENKYFGMIPASDVTAAGVEYYLEVSDGTSIVRDGSASAPITVSVDYTLGIYSVSTARVEISSVKEGITAILSGVNFSDTMTLKVGGKVTDYAFISATQISFTVPEGGLGRCDIQLIDGDRSARLTNAITYFDASSEAEITASEIGKSGEEVKLPITVSANGEIISLDLTIAFERYRFSEIRFEAAETLVDAQTYYSVNGNEIKIAISSIEAMDLSSPVGYLVLTPASVTEAISTKVEMVSALANAIEVATLVDTMLEIKPSFTLKGVITYYAGGAPIAGVRVTLNNGMETYTDENGFYIFTGITTNSVVVTPHLAGAVNNAISATDAGMVLQNATATSSSLSDYQRIAADVDGDGQLTAHDAAYILQKSVGKIEGDFPGTGIEWYFDGKKSTSLTGDVTTLDFVGILLGDVTGDWTATPADEME